MKELYIAPELEILCFAPMEGIASFTPVLGEIALKSSKSGLPISEIGDDDYYEDEIGGDI